MSSLKEIMILALLINPSKCNSIHKQPSSTNQCNINETNNLIYHTSPNIDRSQILTLNYDIEFNSFYSCLITPYTDESDINSLQHFDNNNSISINTTDNNNTIKSDDQKDTNTPITNSFNFASFDSGASILEKSDGIKSSKSILLSRKDKYMMMPCELENKYFIIQLSEDIVIDKMEILNLEHYSSNIKNICIYARTSNDNEISNNNNNIDNSNSHDWFLLSNFTLLNKNKNSILFADSHWVRLLKIEILSYYGNEYYCTLTQIKVFGSTILVHWKNSVMSDLEKADQMKHNITKNAATNNISTNNNVNITISKDITLIDDFKQELKPTKQQSVFTIITERITSLELNLTKQQMQVAHLLNVFNRIDELDNKFNEYQINLTNHMLFQSHGLVRLLNAIKDTNNENENVGENVENNYNNNETSYNRMNDKMDWTYGKSYDFENVLWKKYEQFDRIEGYIQNILFMITNLYWIIFLIIIIQIIFGICVIVYVCQCCQNNKNKNKNKKKYRKLNSSTHGNDTMTLHSNSNKSSTRSRHGKYAFSRTLSRINVINKKKNNRKKFKK